MCGPDRRDGVMLVGATGTGAGQVLGPWIGGGQGAERGLGSKASGLTALQRPGRAT